VVPRVGLLPVGVGGAADVRAAAEAKRGNATDPDFLTRQLAVLYDGASTRAGIGADDLQGLAVTTAETLIQAADITD